jgi:hypothetical protein
MKKYFMTDGAYAMVQSIRPAKPGGGLNDSPGLASLETAPSRQGDSRAPPSSATATGTLHRNRKTDDPIVCVIQWSMMFVDRSSLSKLFSRSPATRTKS